MVDIEKLENLPFKQGKTSFLVEKHGYCMHHFNHRDGGSSKNPYNISRRILKSNIGKSFDMAFHYYCTKVEKRYQHIFLELINKDKSNWKYIRYYHIDDNGNIQPNVQTATKQPVFIKSDDYKIELRHKITGDKRSDFEIICKDNRKYNDYMYSNISHYLYGVKLIYKNELHKTKYYSDYRQIIDKIINIVPTQFVYRAQESDFEPVIISGWIKYFGSKQDPKYKRLMSEKIKKSKKEWLAKYKIPKMSDEQHRAILKARVLKDREETRIKLEAKGMRPNAFTAIKTDTNV